MHSKRERQGRALSDTVKAVLKKNRVFLTDHLRIGDRLYNYLKQEDVLTNDECETLELEGIQSKKVAYFLDIIPFKSQWHYERFIFCLNKTGNKFIADHLTKATDKEQTNRVETLPQGRPGKASKSTSKNTRRSNSVQGPRPKRGNRPPVIDNKTKMAPKKGRMKVMALVIAISCTLLVVAVGILWKPASTISQTELCITEQYKGDERIVPKKPPRSRKLNIFSCGAEAMQEQVTDWKGFLNERLDILQLRERPLNVLVLGSVDDATLFLTHISQAIGTDWTLEEIHRKCLHSDGLVLRCNLFETGMHDASWRSTEQHVIDAAPHFITVAGLPDDDSPVTREILRLLLAGVIEEGGSLKELHALGLHDGVCGMRKRHSVGSPHMNVDRVVLLASLYGDTPRNLFSVISEVTRSSTSATELYRQAGVPVFGVILKPIAPYQTPEDAATQTESINVDLLEATVDEHRQVTLIYNHSELFTNRVLEKSQDTFVHLQLLAFLYNLCDPLYLWAQAGQVLPSTAGVSQDYQGNIWALVFTAVTFAFLLTTLMPFDTFERNNYVVSIRIAVYIIYISLLMLVMLYNCHQLFGGSCLMRLSVSASEVLCVSSLVLLSELFSIDSQRAPRTHEDTMVIALWGGLGVFYFFIYIYRSWLVWRYLGITLTLVSSILDPFLIICVIVVGRVLVERAGTAGTKMTVVVVVLGFILYFFQLIYRASTILNIV